ncbi:Di-N-acetylchitobiase-like [Oopsacas minuta]|uniref:Di-N-acetylchitobiase-like n=1 Tax=Oopsacas minuta TaxID=111878 RepID=A0AAV7K9U0_9METZ|nr:Di-N-acetylchitobiase-like [Oopsacas minuta]
MHSISLFNWIMWIISILIFADSSSSSSVCKCTNQTLCNVIPAPDKVVLGFSLRFDNYKLYDWSRINTIVPFSKDRQIPMEFICYAHSYGASVLIPPIVSKDIILNVSRHSEAVTDILKDVQKNFADGVNFDFEQPLTADESKLYTMLVAKTRVALLTINTAYQVSVDAAWSPDCIDLRCYDYIGLSKASDYLVIMAYDEQSQMAGPPCYAKANSPYNQTLSGIESYLKSGINSSLLVLGLPWYGYIYTCLSFDNERCQIEEKIFRNSQCSDSAGRQLPYSYFMKVIQNDAIRKWDSDSVSPYINVENMNSTQQMWYDDPLSLGFKYELARSLELRGIGFWNIDLMDYSNTLLNKLMRNEMWETIDVFLN